MQKNESASQHGSKPAAKAGEFLIGNDLPVNRLGFGAMRITGKGIWGEPSDRVEAIQVLRRAVELGINFIDTADSYGPNVSEEIIAEALHPYSEGLVIATKGGFDRPGPGQWVENGRPEHLKSACEGSLRRLRLDKVASNRPERAGRRPTWCSKGSAGARHDQTHRAVGSKHQPDSACAKDCANRERPKPL
jgi:hypothetical protein